MRMPLETEDWEGAIRATNAGTVHILFSFSAIFESQECKICVGRGKNVSRDGIVNKASGHLIKLKLGGFCEFFLRS